MHTLKTVKHICLYSIAQPAITKSYLFYLQAQPFAVSIMFHHFGYYSPTLYICVHKNRTGYKQSLMPAKIGPAANIFC